MANTVHLRGAAGVAGVLLACIGCTNVPVAPGAHGAIPRSDQALASRLVGKWSRASCLGNSHLEEALDLRSDGGLEVHGDLHDASGSRKYFAKGSWRVSDGFYFQTIASSDFPGWRPDGEMRHRIVSVTDWEWVSNEHDCGGNIRAWRFPK